MESMTVQRTVESLVLSKDFAWGEPMVSAMAWPMECPKVEMMVEAKEIAQACSMDSLTVYGKAYVKAC